MSLYRQEWGSGDPLIALHPLALESTAFAGVAGSLAARGLRTVAVDLPGFGRSPGPDAPLTAERLAEPVLELARSLERPPVLLGMSLGGRVALEVALRDPGAVRGLVLVAPFLPLRILNGVAPLLRRFDPRWAGAFPMERAWPLLRHLAEALERIPELEHDWLGRASVRVVYYSTCPATRVSFFSAMREMALDPLTGPDSVWSRLADLELPTVFLWGGRDALIPRRHAGEIASALPRAHRMEVPCAGHFVNGAHFRCMRHAIALAVERTLADEPDRPGAGGARTLTPCLADARELDLEAVAEPALDADPAPADRGGSPMSESAPTETAHRPPRRLSGEDAIFVYAETPSMPMHTMGTMILDPSGAPGAFDLDRVIETVAARIHRMPPFRQRLLEIPLGLGHPLMVDDPEFRVGRHVHRRVAPPPGGRRELAEIVAELAAEPLERGKPLWEMWLVEGLENGRVALVTKLHHCIIDGASGSSQMAGLLDLEPSTEAETPEPWSPAPLPGRASLALRSAGSRLVSPVRLGRLLLDTARGTSRRVRESLEVARSNREPLWLLESPPATPFNRAVGRHRSIAFGSAPLDAVKRVKQAFGVTVNDVVLAACAIAVRRYLAARDALPERPLACAIPVSLKSDTEKREFSNKVSLMSIPLPTHLEDPAETVAAVHRGTEDAKRVFRAVEDDLVSPWLELLPPVLTAIGARAYSQLDMANVLPSVANLIVSNMMGPPVPLYFGGARVEAIYPMGPVGEGMGLNLTVLSNMGRLDVGVLACRDAVTDPWEIADGVGEALEELERAAPTPEEPVRAGVG